MNDTKKFEISDLPTIEELQQRFRQKESRLSMKLGIEEAKKQIKSKNTYTYQFILENFLMIERKDKILINKTARKVMKYGAFCISAPLILNISLGRLTKNRIFDVHWLLRFNFRLSLYLVPLFFYSDYCFASYTRISLYLMDKYVERVHKFIETGDPTIINPYLPEEDEDD